MPQNVAQKLISAHLVDGIMRVGTPITVKIDQTLTQDATGTLAMLTLEAIGLDRATTEVSVQYVDHNRQFERRRSSLSRKCQPPFRYLVLAPLPSRPRSFAARRFRPRYRSTSTLLRGNFCKR